MDFYAFKITAERRIKGGCWLVWEADAAPQAEICPPNVLSVVRALPDENDILYEDLKNLFKIINVV